MRPEQRMKLIAGLISVEVVEPRQSLGVTSRDARYLAESRSVMEALPLKLRVAFPAVIRVVQRDSIADNKIFPAAPQRHAPACR